MVPKVRPSFLISVQVPHSMRITTSHHYLEILLAAQLLRLYPLNVCFSLIPAFPILQSPRFSKVDLSSRLFAASRLGASSLRTT